MLPYRPTKPDHKLARIEELDVYGWIGTIDSLAGNDITKWPQVLTVSFEKTIVKLAMNRDVADYNERLQKVLKDKQKEK